MQESERPVIATIDDITTLCEEDPARASATLLALLSDDAADSSALMLAPYGLHLLDRHDDEVAALERIASLEPDDYDTRRILADALMEVGREAESREAFRAALRLCAGAQDVSELAKLIASWELYDLCAEAAREWTHLDKDVPAAHELLGVALGMSGEHDAAVGAFRIASELEPEERRHRRSLAYALSRSGRMLEGWRAFWGDPPERNDGPTECAIFPGPIHLDWVSSGTELVQRVTSEGERRLPMLATNIGWHKIGDRRFVIEFESPALRTKLVIDANLSDVRFSASSLDGAPVQNTDIELWRSIVSDCVDALGQGRAVPWYALIGTRPVSTFEPSDQQLVEAGQFGRLELHPSPRVREHVGGPALQNERARLISPIAVEGVCHGFHDWGVDADEEAARVRFLCAFLSLVWNSAWEMKVAPQTGYADELVDKLESTVVVPDENLMTAVQPVRLEPWMEAGLARLTNDELLQNAVHAFHEAMLLVKEHPSVAAMRFVTCCEVIGGRIKPGVGSGARVRATFESVLPTPEAEELWEAYKRRNETAHEAWFHGLELSFGLSDSDPVQAHNPGFAFSLGLLNRLRGVTRDALLAALASEGARASAQTSSRDR